MTPEMLRAKEALYRSNYLGSAEHYEDIKMAYSMVDKNPRTNPKKQFGDSKPAVHLVPPALILEAAIGLQEGAIKYGAYNWRETKIESMTYIAAMLRHLYAYLDGEDQDPESALGKSHLSGVAASLAILLDAINGDFLIDNRPPKGPAPKMVVRKTEMPR